MAAKRKATAKKRSTKKAESIPGTTAKKPGRPPKKGAVIDAILKESPNLSAGEVLEKAKERRTKVSLQSIYNNATWKSLHAGGASRRKGKAPRKTNGRNSTGVANGVQSDFTRCVKKLGVAKARELLDVIAAYENA